MVEPPGPPTGSQPQVSGEGCTALRFTPFLSSHLFWALLPLGVIHVLPRSLSGFFVILQPFPWMIARSPWLQLPSICHRLQSLGPTSSLTWCPWDLFNCLQRVFPFKNMSLFHSRRCIAVGDMASLYQPRDFYLSMLTSYSSLYSSLALISFYPTLHS